MLICSVVTFADASDVEMEESEEESEEERENENDNVVAGTAAKKGVAAEAEGASMMDKIDAAVVVKDANDDPMVGEYEGEHDLRYCLVSIMRYQNMPHIYSFCIVD